MNSENKTLTKEELATIKENGREFVSLNGINEIDIEGQQG
jgi:hypothetical protein